MRAFIRAIRSMYKYGKLGAGLGTFFGAIVGFDKNNKTADAAAGGLAIGAVVGGVLGFISSLVGERYRIVKAE